MAEVRMSIQEYDNLVSEKNMYKEIVESIVTPTLDQWNINWYNAHDTANLSIGSSDIYSGMSKQAGKFLKSLMDECIAKFIEENNLVGNFDLNDNISMTFGYMSHIQEEKEPEDVG